jgi:hypothetical protein
MKKEYKFCPIHDLVYIAEAVYGKKKKMVRVAPFFQGENHRYLI